MKTYRLLVNIVLIGLTLILFFLAYQKLNLPFDENGVFISKNGITYKSKDAVNNLIVAVVCVVFLVAWNFLFNKENKK